MRRTLPAWAGLSLLACTQQAAPPPAKPRPKARVSEQALQPKGSIDSAREGFLAACAKKVAVPEYCNCAWGEFREVFKDADLAEEIAGEDPRLTALATRTRSACARHLPEEHVQKRFMDGCIGKEEYKAKYCACAWPALRKQMSVADFVIDDGSPRLTAARRSMTAECKGTLPEPEVHAAFMRECTKGQQERRATCECVWKKLSARYTLEEYVANLADPAQIPDLKACRPEAPEIPEK